MIKNISSGYWKENGAKIVCREIIFLLNHYEGIPRLVRFKALFLVPGMLGRMLPKRRFVQEKSRVTDEYMDKFFCYKKVRLRQLLAMMLPRIRR